MSTLSLIIPVHNRWELTQRTLLSVEAQTRLPEALILVDNCCEDEVSNALRDEATRLASKMTVTLISCPTPGAPAARNAGLEYVDTEWVMYFDSDDTMLPEHIATAMSSAISHPDAEIIGWDSVFVDKNGRTLRRKIFHTDRYLYNAIMHGSLATQSYMARTELFRRVHGWNPDAKIWNDLELSVRLILERPTIVKALTTAPGVQILTHSDSITGPDFSSKAAERDHTLDILISLSEKTETPGIIPIIALKRAILAACCLREGHKDTATELYTRALTLPLSRAQRFAVIFSYHYTSLSLPGAARLLQPFFT